MNTTDFPMKLAAVLVSILIALAVGLVIAQLVHGFNLG